MERFNIIDSSPCNLGNALGLSRLEKYLTIIEVLNGWDSITKKQIMNKADLNLISLKEDLRFLVKLDLIREKTLRNRTTYSTTHKGLRISKYFGLEGYNYLFAGTRITRID